METKVAYQTNPLAALHPLFHAAIAKTESRDEIIQRYSRLWGEPADLIWSHIGGRGPVPFLIANGRSVMLRSYSIPGTKGMRYKEAE